MLKKIKKNQKFYLQRKNICGTLVSAKRNLRLLRRFFLGLKGFIDMKKEFDLGHDKINKLLISFAIPCVISMLINSVYNIVDQIFIGKGVGTLGNAATNVIFPLVILANAIAGLIGNGAAANLSLKLGEKKENEARKSVGSSITLTFIIAILFSGVAYVFLPKLVYMFGCTENVYSYALSYGQIVLLGAPFMIIYSVLASIIRADGNPKYSMIMLVVGAIINIVLDPIFIFGFKMGVFGGGLATVIGQVISFIIAICYLPKLKSIKLTKEDYKINKSVKRTLSLGLSSFITQVTILVLFVFMNNMMTKFGASSIYGADIPLSVYGVISKINSLYISFVLGVSIGAQPIIGFNYGAGNLLRVKEILRKVLMINFAVGIIFNLIFIFFPSQIAGVFISPDDANYTLFMDFATLMCHSFLLVCAFNAMEMTTSIVVQSLGNVLLATAVSFIRQIILFIPLALLLSLVFNKGLEGILYAGCLADSITFIIAGLIFTSEYKKLGTYSAKENEETDTVIPKTYMGQKVVITISREYGSGGRYVGELLARNLGIPFYDKNLITLSAKESGLAPKYVKEQEQTLEGPQSNDDLLYIATTKVIKNLYKQGSCVIVGRCGNYILKDKKDVLRVYLYSSMEDKINRVTKYYHIEKDKAVSMINKINKERKKHYKYYTNTNLDDYNNYDIVIDTSKFGVEETAKILEQIITKIK